LPFFHSIFCTSAADAAAADDIDAVFILFINYIQVWNTKAAAAIKCSKKFTLF
jgi:hypothetical protein